MISVFSSFARKHHRLTRMALGLLGAVAGLSLVKLVEARADSLDAFKTQIIALAPDTMGYLAAAFPEEFHDIAQKVQSATKVGGNIRQVSFDAFLALRQRYAPAVGDASDTAQAAMIESLITVHQAVLDNEGPEVCARFAVLGYEAFFDTPLAEKYSTLQSQHMLNIFAAMRDGLDNPVARGLATDDDWGTVIDLMLASGSSQDALNAIVESDMSNPLLCQANLDLLRATNMDGNPSSQLVRAELLEGIAAQ